MDSVQLNGFSISIIADGRPVKKVIYGEDDYFGLPDRTEYMIRLANNHDARVDAHVWVNGEKAGVWRIGRKSSITIERPAHIARKFTLVSEKGEVGRNAGIAHNDTDNGLIKVVFKPELMIRPVFYNYGYGHKYEYEYDGYTDTVTPYNK